MIELKKVTLKNGAEVLKLITPYHEKLPGRLKALGGSWSSQNRAWYLPTDIEKEVREICKEFFFIDPLSSTPADTVSVKVNLKEEGIGTSSLWLFGREVLRRPGRDSSVLPGEGVSIIAGGFSSSGGSRNNPQIGTAKENTTILVRNVPKEALQSTNQKHEVVQTNTISYFERAKEIAKELSILFNELSQEECNEILFDLYSEKKAVEEQRV